MLADDLCTHPSSLVRHDPVSGKPQYVAASKMRAYEWNDSCGPEGKFFEQGKPVHERESNNVAGIYITTGFIALFVFFLLVTPFGAGN